MTIKVKLILDKSLEKFYPEIEYCSFLLEQFYDVKFVDKGEDKTIFYGAKSDGSSLHIPSNIFSKIFFINESGIYSYPSVFSKLLLKEIKKMDSVIIDRNKINFDAFAIIFSIVSRIEERNPKIRDGYNRFSSSEDFLAQNNLLVKVPVDQAMDLIAKSLFNPSKIYRKTEYKVIPTHDVDALKSYHRPLLPIRYFIGDLFKRGKPLSAIKRLLDYFPGEPQQSFNYLMSLSEKYGLKSRFFFMSKTIDSHDSPYMTYYPNTVKRMLNNIKKRGHIVGFHPGYMTYSNQDKWHEQKKYIENFINAKVYEGRQHMLQYDINCTPQIWNQNNMKIDYTLSFPDKIGFRNGTCRPIYYYDLKSRNQMNLISLSTSIMDFTLFGGKYNNYECDEALKLCKSVISTCKKYDGSLVILIHTGRNNFQNINFFYSELLNLACKA